MERSEQVKFLRDFANDYEWHTPEPKDLMRAKTCKSNAVAKAQLRRIEDVDKFYRRLKALLEAGWVITDLEGTSKERYDSPLLQKWLASAVKIFSGSEPIAVKRTKLNMMTKIMSI